MNHDEDGDGSCEETSQQKNCSKNSKSESSISLSTSNEQVCNITHIILNDDNDIKNEPKVSRVFNTSILFTYFNELLGNLVFYV